MEVFSAAVNSLDAVIWSMALVGLCLGAGLYLSVRLGFPQLRLLVEMVICFLGRKKVSMVFPPFSPLRLL